MIGTFKQKSPGNVVVLLIFGLLIKLPLFLAPKNIVATATDGPLYHWLLSVLTPENAFACSMLALGFLFTQALLITYLANEYRMMSRQNYLPGMAYLLITSLLPEWTYLSAPLIASSFIIWMFIKLFALYNQQNAKPQVYNIGLLAGISSYIYFPSACFVVCVLIGLMILKPFRLNEIILFILGCITPYYFYGVYLFLFAQFSVAAFVPHIAAEVPEIKSSIGLAVSTFLVMVPFIAGGFYLQKQMGKMLIQVRKNWSILLLYLLVAFFVPFLGDGDALYALVLMAVPFSLFHACGYFYPARRIVPLLLFFLTIAFVLYQQFATPTWH